MKILLQFILFNEKYCYNLYLLSEILQQFIIVVVKILLQFIFVRVKILLQFIYMLVCKKCNNL